MMKPTHDRFRGRGRTLTVVGLLGTALAAGACGDITVPDYNNPSIEELEGNPTPAGIKAAASGVLIGARNGLTDRTGYVAMTGIIGREAYIIDSSDPRYVAELLQGPLTNSGAFGAGLWTERYANIRNTNIILSAVDKVAGMSDVDKEAVRGFAKTMQALDFLLVINSRDTNGAPINVGGSIRELAPIENKQAVFAHIVQLLDQGEAHLKKGGSAFPFWLGSGFAGFDAPASFLKVNRALRARVAVYQKDYATAAALLNGSATFVDAQGDLKRGAWHYYSTGDGAPNQLTSTFIYAHPRLVSEAENAQDLRLQAKIKPAERSGSQQGVSSSLSFKLYPDASAMVPIIRNEELILLRAEARWFTNDKAGAMADLNAIRTRSGGLAAIGAPGSDADFVTALLRERRYSLMFEGHRWIDHRRFGRLDALGKDVSSHVIYRALQVPEAECLARSLPSPCDLPA